MVVTTKHGGKAISPCSRHDIVSGYCQCSSGSWDSGSVWEPGQCYSMKIIVRGQTERGSIFKECFSFAIICVYSLFNDDI